MDKTKQDKLEKAGWSVGNTEDFIKEDDLALLCRELLDILAVKEESDSGREFRPTTISSCRCMTVKRLNEIFKEMKEIIKYD